MILLYIRRKTEEEQAVMKAKDTAQHAQKRNTKETKRKIQLRQMSEKTWYEIQSQGTDRRYSHIWTTENISISLRFPKSICLRINIHFVISIRMLNMLYFVRSLLDQALAK